MDLDAYVDVPTRVNEFWKKYPNGAIVTELLRDDDLVGFKTQVFRDSKDLTASLIATGHSEELRKGKGGSKQKEKAETVSVGRALALAGFLATKIASREEMESWQESNAGPVEVQERDHAPLDTLPDSEVDDLEPMVREWLARNKDKKPQFKNYLVTLGVVNVPPNAKLRFLLQQIPSSQKASDLLRWMGENDQKISADELADKLIEEGVAVEA